MSELKLQCSNCKKKTKHIDQGSDTRPDRRYYCTVCRKANPK